MAGVTTEKILGWATALPEVTEKQHHLFRVPVWQVLGRTFLGMGRDESTVVFCVPEESANAAAAADPEHAAAVRRKDARRSFLGLEVQPRRLARTAGAAVPGRRSQVGAGSPCLARKWINGLSVFVARRSDHWAGLVTAGIA